MKTIKFRVLDLFVIVFVVAVSARLLTGESIVVSFAAVLVLLSAIGIPWFAWISMVDLWNTIRRAWSNQRPTLLGSRIKWIFFDGAILVWLILVIALSNFILENYAYQGNLHLWVSFLLGPALMIWLLLKTRQSRTYQD